MTEIGKRHKLLDLIGKRAGVYHSAVFTCFAFDPVFFSSYYMPKLRSVGIRNILVLVDAGQCDDLAAEYGSFGSHIYYGDGKGYNIIRQECSSNGFFHPKITLFLGSTDALTFVGSGNLTYGGMAYNEEIWGAFCISEQSRACMPIISSVWKYLSSRLDSCERESVKTQVSWIREYSPWIKTAESATDNVFIDGDGLSYVLATNEAGNTLLSKIIDAVGKSKVHSISMVAPFYDSTGVAIKRLYENFFPKSIECFIDDAVGITPHKIQEPLKSTCTFYKGNDKIQKVHAKIIQFECADKTVIAIGSANATAAALGDGKTYANDEADIIITASEQIDYIQELGIRDNSIAITEITKPKSSLKALAHDGSYSVNILSCEHDDKVYHFILSKAIENAYIQYRDGNGNYWDLDEDDFDQEFEVSEESMEDARVVYLMAGDDQISNAVVITQNVEIIRSCPNKLLGDQEAWMAAAIENGVWYHYLEKILGSVPIGDGESVANGGFRSGPAVPKGLDETELSLEQYNDTHYTGVGDVGDFLSRNVRDYLASALRMPDDEEDNEESEEISQEKIDSGEPEMNQPKKKKARIEEPQSAPKLLKKLSKYLDRLYSFYSQKCKSLDEENHPETILGMAHKLDFFRKPRVGDYNSISNAVLALSLMSSEEVVESDQASIHEIKANFEKLVGRFALIYRLGGDVNEDLEDARQKFFVYTCILASHLHWGIDGTKLKTILLNVFELFDNEAAIKAAFTAFEAELRLSILSVCDESLAIISKALKLYLKFHKKDRKAFVTEIGQDWEYAIIHKTSLGFVLCDRISDNDMKEYKQFPIMLRAYLPGYLDSKRIWTIHGPKACVIE